MPENLGTMILKVTADASGVVAGMTVARTEANKLQGESSRLGNQLRGTFDDGRASAKQFFDNLRGGNFNGLLQQGRQVAQQFQQVQASLRQSATQATGQGAAGGGESLAAGLGGAARAGGLAVGVFAALYQQSRAASRELAGIGRAAQRIGVSTDDVQILNRGFERLGLSAEESEETINRLAMHLGELRTNADAPVGRSLRQLGLDPSQFAGQNTLQQVEQIADALRGVRDPAERAALASDFFGRSWMNNTNLFRVGGGIFREEAARARASNNLFSQDSIRASQDAEEAWRRFGNRFTDIGRNLRSTYIETFGFVSQRLSERLAGAFGTPAGAGARTRGPARPPGFDTQLRTVLDEAADAHQALEGLLTLTPPTSPLAAGARGVAVQDRLRGLRDEADLLVRGRQLAEEAGLTGANATRQELAAVLDLVKARRDLVAISADPNQLAHFDSIAQATALARVTAHTRDSVADLEHSLRFEGVGLRTQAIGAGLAGAGATAADLAQVKDLAELLDQFRNQPGARSESVEALRGRLAEIAQTRRDSAALSAVEERERTNLLNRNVALQGAFGHEEVRLRAAAQERLDVERGISAEYARRNRLATEEEDLLGRQRGILQQLRSPLDEFNTHRADIGALQGRGLLSPDQARRARGAAFLQFESSNFPLPGNLALSGTRRGSIEEARDLADRQTRLEIRNQDPQERVRAAMEAAAQRQEKLVELQRALGDAASQERREGNRILQRAVDGIDRLNDSLNVAQD